MDLELDDQVLGAVRLSRELGTALGGGGSLALVSPAASFLTGVMLPVDGGMLRAL